MNKIYLSVDASDEHFNVDVYEPKLPAMRFPPKDRMLPAIIIICGAGGKDFLTGGQLCGKYAVAYHDLAQHLSDVGFWVFVPARRGDPERSPAAALNISSQFKDRLPVEYWSEEKPNEGLHTHFRQIEELRSLISSFPRSFESVDVGRIGLIGKSAGGGIALRLAFELGAGHIKSLLLWGCSLRTSQWFRDRPTFVQKTLVSRSVRIEPDAFLNSICDPIDYVDKVEAPILFSCTAPDPFAPEPPEPDPYSNPGEQAQLLHYAIRSRNSRASIVKGAEHTMHRTAAAWQNYVGNIEGWFRETLVHRGE